MTAGLIASLLLAAAALAFVAAPLLRKEQAAREEDSAALSLARELQSRRQQLLASLRDLEDDRATDKLDEQDYEELRAQLSAEAIEVMRQLDTLEEEREAQAEKARKAAQPLRHPGARRPDPLS